MRIAALLLLSLLPVADSCGEELTPGQQQQIERIVLDLRHETEAPGISVAVANDNRLVYSNAFGLADVENDVACTSATKFRTASIAKSMTAVLVMKLAEEGKLDPDASVRQYVPEFPKKRWTVTSRQLLGHLGGIRHYKSPQETVATQFYPSLSDALETFRDDPLLHEPGSAFRYTTFGYNLLGNVAEGASGRNFINLLQNYIFDPAQMTQTVVDSQSAIVKNRTRGYVRIRRPLQQLIGGGDSPSAIRNAPLHDTSMKIPGGGLLSTPSDLVRFACAVNTNRLCSDATKQMMWTEQQTTTGKKTGYGLGWSVRKRDGRKVVAHTGSQAGTSTVLILYPDQYISVALMCNLQKVRLTDVAHAIANVLLPTSSTAEHQDDQTHEPSGDAQRRSIDLNEQAIRRLSDAITYEVERKDIPALSIALVDGTRTVWSAGFGFQNEQKTVPASADSVYRVGSVSKLFTDLAVMQLVEAGRLNLDEPITMYLPDFRPHNSSGTPITLRQLMSHQSGLVRESPVGHYFDPTEPSLDATVASLNDTSLVYPPQTRTKYSNAAIAVVGKVLESALSESHPARVRSQILKPLQMDHSGFELDQELRAQLATGWMWTYDGRRFPAPNFLLGTGPAGNLYASVNDLAKFMSCLLNDGRLPQGQLLKSQSLQEMMTPVKTRDGRSQNFGLGFHLSQLDGETRFGHGGAVYGYSTEFQGLPKRGLGVVAASSLDGTNGVVTRLTEYALRLMIAVQDGKPLPAYRKTQPIPSERAAELIGRWKSQDGASLVQISELNGRVFLRKGVFRHELQAAADDGQILIDDVFRFGTPVRLTEPDRMSVDSEAFERMSEEAPLAAAAEWNDLIGEYGWDHNVLYILEDHGQLYALIEWFYYYPLEQIDEVTFAFPDYGLYHGERLKFERDASGAITGVVAAEVRFDRRDIGTRDGETFQITPVRPINELRKEALVATPPTERGTFRDSNLVDLTKVDPTIRLDIRYAGTNNFTGAVFYQQPRAFMQRPAAQAVSSASDQLKKHGLGLLVHDAYRPWHVTRMFWDATPEDLRDFVADPSKGSRHNRGCAVDLTMYDLKSGKPIQMVAGYDEFSKRSYPLYPGGTARKRWYRDLLRRTMEAADFRVYEYEWWHFDYKDWQKYRIGNVTFEQLDPPTR